MKSKKSRIGCWNVRTLVSLGDQREKLHAVLRTMKEKRFWPCLSHAGLVRELLEFNLILYFTLELPPLMCTV